MMFQSGFFSNVWNIFILFKDKNTNGNFEELFRPLYIRYIVNFKKKSAKIYSALSIK